MCGAVSPPLPRKAADGDGADVEEIKQDDVGIDRWWWGSGLNKRDRGWRRCSRRRDGSVMGLGSRVEVDGLKVWRGGGCTIYCHSRCGYREISNGGI